MKENNNYFEFKYLYSLIGRNILDTKVNNLLDYINKEVREFFQISEPPLEEVQNDNDKWKCYDSEELGLVFEIVNDVFACVSFFSNVNTYNNRTEIRIPYLHLLLKNLSVNSHRDEVRSMFGAPYKHEKNLFDQFVIDDKITMGVLYNESSGLTSVISYGAAEIFSNPDKAPNRYSFIFWSLS